MNQLVSFLARSLKTNSWERIGKGRLVDTAYAVFSPPWMDQCFRRAGWWLRVSLQGQCPLDPESWFHHKEIGKPPTSQGCGKEATKTILAQHVVNTQQTAATRDDDYSVLTPTISSFKPQDPKRSELGQPEENLGHLSTSLQEQAPVGAWLSAHGKPVAGTL